MRVASDPVADLIGGWEPVFKKDCAQGKALMTDWIRFYDLRHSLIYVHARHRDVHYRTIADDIRGYLPQHSAAVLDYGCSKTVKKSLSLDPLCRHDAAGQAQDRLGGGRNPAQRDHRLHNPLIGFQPGPARSRPVTSK